MIISKFTTYVLVGAIVSTVACHIGFKDYIQLFQFVILGAILSEVIAIREGK